MTFNFIDPALLAAQFVPLIAAGQVAVYTDLDGTLLDFVPDGESPDKVIVPDSLKTSFTRLQDKFGVPVAAITGRGPEFIVKHFGDLPFSAGHGVVLREKAGQPIITADLGINLERLMSIAAPEEKSQSLRFEYKKSTLSLAIHHEDNDQATRQARETAQRITDIYNQNVKESDSLMTVGAGRLVFEIKPEGPDKGKALASLMKIYPGKQPIFLGDTALDLPAMKIARALGGFAIGVGPKPPEGCNFYLPTPAHARQFIQHLAR